LLELHDVWDVLFPPGMGAPPISGAVFSFPASFDVTAPPAFAGATTPLSGESLGASPWWVAIGGSIPFGCWMNTSPASLTGVDRSAETLSVALPKARLPASPSHKATGWDIDISLETGDRPLLDDSLDPCRLAPMLKMAKLDVIATRSCCTTLSRSAQNYRRWLTMALFWDPC
jgi:hypothetical protein